MKSKSESFSVIRQMLGCYLHQDYDAEFDSIATAIVVALQHTDVARLLAELVVLDTQPDSIIEEVLSDHQALLWDKTTPREFLGMLRTLASLV